MKLQKMRSERPRKGQYSDRPNGKGGVYKMSRAVAKNYSGQSKAKSIGKGRGY